MWKVYDSVGDYMLKGRVLSLCDYTGNMVRPWAEDGYECVCLDLQHTGRTFERFASGGSIEKLQMDVFQCPSPTTVDYDIVFAFPPCTHLAVSGARWFQSKGMKALIESLSVVEQCRELCEESGAPYMIENPVSTLATYWRKPDHAFDPYQYAGYLQEPSTEAYTKKTCLWVGNGFVMPKPKAVKPAHGSKMHRLPPSKDRANLRSETPKGFARAVFEANRKARS